MKAKVFEFGPFSLDSVQRELRRSGTRLKLPGSRLRLLLLFVTRPGDLITREEIAACLWKDSQTVDIIGGINTALNQLRTQLGDDPAAPTYIETVIGTGYRFIAKVSERESSEQTDQTELEVTALPPPAAFPPPIAITEQASFPFTASHTETEHPTHRRRTVIAAAIALLVCAPIFYLLFRPAAPRQTAPTAEFQLARITGSGDIEDADISPDGNYVAFTRDVNGAQSLWLKQLATGRLLQLAVIGKYQCPGVAFSPDGNFVYYVRKEFLEPSGELFQVPFLGGNPKQLLAGISGAPAISPDGRKVAFVRSTLVTHGEDSIVTAFLDGSDERILATYRAPGIHFNRVTWTPDGQALIFPSQSSLMMIPAAGGVAHAISEDRWSNIDNVSKLPPGRNLIVVGKRYDSSLPQIFEVSLQNGTSRAITHDLSHYTSARATADGLSLLAVQDLIVSSIQTLAPGRESEVHSLNSENQNEDGVAGLAWTPGGKIVYSSQIGRSSGMLEIDSKGANPTRISDEDAASTVFANPRVSGRGDFIAVAHWFTDDGANIWRMDRNGSNEKRLTFGKQDFPPSITPDGEWVIYASVQGDKSVLMKVSSQGGPATRLTDYDSDSPAVSPDGKWIACSYVPQQSQAPRLAIVPIAGGPPVKVFQLPESAIALPLIWTADGRAVTFINNVNGTGNIWQQPVAGGPATPVSHFRSGKIFNFDWSRDGRLALSRGSETVDAVLIKNFHEPGH